jgi:iron complex transport system substrate-binding protein
MLSPLRSFASAEKKDSRVRGAALDRPILRRIIRLRIHIEDTPAKHFEAGGDMHISNLPTRSERLGPIFEPPARRVVSLVPSLTEAVFMIGASERLAGRTRYCVRPKDAAGRVPVVGGTKDPDIDAIRALRPDLVLANREENTKDAVMKIAADFPVLLTDPKSPDDVPSLWAELGAALGLPDRGREAADEVLHELALLRLDDLDDAKARPRFIYFVWKDPWMVAGHDTYISRMLCAAGFVNALPPECVRFPRMEADALLAIETDAYFYCSEPYAFKLPGDPLLREGTAATPDGDGLRVQNNSLALIVDSEPLSWYPSQTSAGLRYAADLYKRICRAQK